jgi:hypothetical protein
MIKSRTMTKTVTTATAGSDSLTTVSDGDIICPTAFLPKNRKFDIDNIMQIIQ